MKIYIYRYGSLCEPDIIDAFKRIGLEIVEESAEIYNKSIIPSESAALASSVLTKGGFAFAFTINFFPWLSDICQLLNITYISLIVDSPVLELYSNAISNPVNRIFLFDKMLYEEFEQYNKGHIFHMPLAANTSRTDEIISLASYSDKKKYASDISFIGSTYQEKCPFNNAVLSDYERGFVDGIINAQIGVYGFNFIESMLTEDMAEKLLESIPDHYEFPASSRKNLKALVAQYYLSVKVAEQERLRMLRMLSDNFNVDIYTGSDTSGMPDIHNRGFAKSLTEMPLIFNNSKININITAKSIRSGLSLRIFDVLGCGGFLITNYQAELPEFFEIGKDLVAYESETHFKELCSYYLEHDDERKEIARHGYETIKKYHTYDIRVLQIIDKAFPAH